MSSTFRVINAPSSVLLHAQYRKMDSLVMVERRNIFHNLLIDQIKECHEQFLQVVCLAPSQLIWFSFSSLASFTSVTLFVLDSVSCI